MPRTNKEVKEVMEIFATCLGDLYTEAGLKLPHRNFDPKKEAKRLTEAIAAKSFFAKDVCLPDTISSGANIHRVPPKQWRRWSYQARWMFNNVMAHMADQSRLTHPDYEDAPGDYWDTIRWNAAWISACLVDNFTRCR